MYRFRFLICAMLLASCLEAEDPWGSDSDLVNGPVEEPVPTYSPWNKLAQGMIWFHQELISPADGPRSHFFPSSSQYALEAIRKHGVLKGIPMGCDRLMRENSEEWVYRQIWHQQQWMKYDPVP